MTKEDLKKNMKYEKPEVSLLFNDLEAAVGACAPGATDSALCNPGATGGACNPGSAH